MMRYFGIKKPDGVIWWITDSKHNSWLAFFQFPSDKDTLNAHRSAHKRCRRFGFR